MRARPWLPDTRVNVIQWSFVMSELVFFTNPQSRGRIAHWMLEEVGEPYTTQWLQYGPEMKSASYRAINPMGKVPRRHGNVVVTEAAAICAYRPMPADKARRHRRAPGPRHYRWMFLPQGHGARSWPSPWGGSACRSRAMVGFGNTPTP